MAIKDTPSVKEKSGYRESSGIANILVNGPLALFLLAGTVVLILMSYHVFISGSIDEHNKLVDRVNVELKEYKVECLKLQSSGKEINCVEDSLKNAIAAKLIILDEKYSDLSSSYSVIAIITGFFGVLMTVLVIHFSLVGKEEYNQKIKSLKSITDELTSKNLEIEKNWYKVEQINDLIKESKEASEKLVEDVKLSSDRYLDRNINQIQKTFESMQKLFDDRIRYGLKDAEDKLSESLKQKLSELESFKENITRVQEEQGREINYLKEISKGDTLKSLLSLDKLGTFKKVDGQIFITLESQSQLNNGLYEIELGTPTDKGKLTLQKNIESGLLNIAVDSDGFKGFSVNDIINLKIQKIGSEVVVCQGFVVDASINPIDEPGKSNR